MSALDRARAWLHGDEDTDPRQLVRELVAALEHQPEAQAVYFLEDEHGLWRKTGAADFGYWEKSGSRKTMKLYTTPPAPVVPEGMVLVPVAGLVREAERLRYRSNESFGLLGHKRTDAGAQMVYTAEILEAWANGTGAEVK